MVTSDNVRLFRKLIVTSRQKDDTRLAVTRLITEAKAYQEAVIKPGQTGMGDSSDDSMYIEEDARRTFVENGRKVLKSLGVEFPDLPLDLFCDTMVTAADGA